MALPLDGVRVVEMGYYTAGPVCGRYLRDLGADVVRIEPGAGDPTRQAGGKASAAWSFLFGQNNAGKQSISLDLKDPEGSRRLGLLLGQADVFLCSFPPDVMARLHLSPEDCRERNEQLVYCGVSGFGLDAPVAQRALDVTIQAQAGMMNLTGHGGRPTKIGISICDDLAAQTATFGILTALLERDATGTGQLVDVAIYDAAVWATEYRWPSLLESLPFDEQLGNADPCSGVEDVVATADGRLAVSLPWSDPGPELSEVLGGVTSATPRQGLEHLRDWASTRTTAEAVSRLEAAGVVCSPVNAISEVMTTAMAVDGELLDIPDGGMPDAINSPLIIDGTRLRPAGPAPELDEHDPDLWVHWGAHDQ